MPPRYADPNCCRLGVKIGARYLARSLQCTWPSSPASDHSSAHRTAQRGLRPQNETLEQSVLPWLAPASCLDKLHAMPRFPVNTTRLPVCLLFDTQSNHPSRRDQNLPWANQSKPRPSYSGVQPAAGMTTAAYRPIRRSAMPFKSHDGGYSEYRGPISFSRAIASSRRPARSSA